MTNFTKFKTMTLKELVDFLDAFGQFDGSPWMDWFNATYCNKCESIECTVNEKNAFFSGHTVDCAYCELEHRCKYFLELEDIPDTKTVIEMWLNEEAI